MLKPYVLVREKPKNFDKTFRIVKAGPLTEVYVMEKFERQALSKPGIRRSLKRRPDSALRARRQVRWMSVMNADPKRSYFWTATFADDVQNYDDGLVRWKRFIRKLKKEFPNLVYVAVPEVQPRSGRWHFHAILCNLPSQKEMKKKYGKMRNRDNKTVDAWMFHFTKIWSKANGGGQIHRANIQVARSIAGVCGYLGKYLTKDVGGTVPVGRRNYYAGGRSLRFPEITDDTAQIPDTKPDFVTSYKDAIGRKCVFARFVHKS